MGLLNTSLVKPNAWPPPHAPGEVAALLRYVRQRDPIGHRVHCAFAMVHLLTLPLITAGSSLTFAVLVGYALLRLPNTWRCYSSLLRVPLVWLLAAWIAWTALTAAWSPDPSLAITEWWTLRMALLPAALWPVLGIAPWLVAAALIGVFAQQALQLSEYLGVTDLRSQEGGSGRVGGWIHPIQTGAWCVAAMCWHLSATMRARGLVRWLSLAGLAAAALGLIASQSRGPWISGALALPIMLVVVAIRRPQTRRTAVILMIFGVVAAAAAWPVMGRFVVDRVHETVEEYRNVWENGAPPQSMGERVLWWGWAWDMYCESPIVGLGAGSYRQALSEQPSYHQAIERWPEKTDEITRSHPHSLTFHILATTGTIGGLIVLSVVVLALRGAWRDPSDHLYADGALFVLISWLIGAQFDSYHLAGHYLGIFMLAVALTLPQRDLLDADGPADRGDTS